MFIEGFYNESSNLQVSDTVRVYLRNSGSPYKIVDSAIAVISDSGKAGLTFSNAASGNYYIQLLQRNSIQTWSATGLAMTHGSISNYNFTTANSQAYGNNVKQADTSPVRFAIYSGDVNQEGNVDLSDVLLIYNDASAFMTGYVSSDVTGDNISDLSDFLIAYNNASEFVSVIRP